MQSLADRRIFFEAYAINVAGKSHEYTKLPLPSRELYETALNFAKSNKGSIGDHFARLSFLQQKTLGQTLFKIDSTNEHSPWEPQSVVVAFESQGSQLRRSVLGKIKTFFGSEKLDSRDSCVRITLMRSLKEADVIMEEKEMENMEEEGGEIATKSVGGHHGETAEHATEADRISEATAPESARTPNKEPLRLKDAVGRNFTFPFKYCATWGVSSIPYVTTLSVLFAICG